MNLDIVLPERPYSYSLDRTDPWAPLTFTVSQGGAPTVDNWMSPNAQIPQGIVQPAGSYPDFKTTIQHYGY